MKYKLFYSALLPTFCNSTTCADGTANRSLARFPSGLADHVKQLVLYMTMLVALFLAAPAHAVGPIVSFDASTLALTNGTTVTSWGGQTAFGTPTYLTAQTPNGRPAVAFNGSDRMGDNIALPAAGGDWILVAVIKPNSIGAYHNLADDNPSSRPMLWIDPGFNYELNFSGGGGAKAAGTGTGGWDIVIADSSLNQLYVNSPTANASGGGAVSYSATKLYDFFHRDGGQTYQGQVAELRIYNNRAAFGGDFAALYNEIHAKWIAPLAINTPPTANAGAAQTAQCTGISSADVMLDGSASSDPDGDALTYAWSWAGGSATGISPIVLLPLGTNVVTLTVSDPDGEVSMDTVVMTVQDTTVPTVNAGADVTIEATSTAGVDYDVSAQVSASDTCCNVSTSISPVGTYPLGANTVTVSATDCSGNNANDSMVVNVVDTTAPIVTATLTPVSRGDDGDDSDEGRYMVQFTVSDIVDPNPTVSAVLNIGGYATPVTVTNGQIIEFEFENEKTEIEVEGGKVEIEAPSMTFSVTATDASGNSTSASAQPQGLTGDNDDDYDRKDDHDD